MKERLIKFLAYLGISQRKFEINCGLSNGFIDKIGDSIRKNNLNKISDKYPELNTNWLKTGEGDMLNKEETRFVNFKIQNPDLNVNDLIKVMDSLTNIMRANTEIEKVKVEIEKIKAEANAESIRLNAENERIKLENERINAEVNERHSKNIERMLNMLTGESGLFEKKELYQKF